MAKMKCEPEKLLIFSPPPEMHFFVETREGVGSIFVIEALVEGEFAEAPGHIAKLLGEHGAAHTLIGPEANVRLEIPLKKLSEVKAPLPSKETG